MLKKWLNRKPKRKLLMKRQNVMQLLQHAHSVAPQLLRTHPQAAQAHVQRWLGNRVEYFKA